jgi:excisionase family DNA binding protein
MSNPATNDHLLTVKEVKERLRVCAGTVYRLMDAGLFKTAKIGRSRRILASSFEDYLRRSFTGGEA